MVATLQPAATVSSPVSGSIATAASSVPENPVNYNTRLVTSLLSANPAWLSKVKNLFDLAVEYRMPACVIALCSHQGHGGTTTYSLQTLPTQLEVGYKVVALVAQNCFDFDHDNQNVAPHAFKPSDFYEIPEIELPDEIEKALTEDGVSAKFSTIFIDGCNLPHASSQDTAKFEHLSKIQMAVSLIVAHAEENTKSGNTLPISSHTWELLAIENEVNHAEKQSKPQQVYYEFKAKNLS